MVGNELGVEQTKPACNQMRYKMDEGDLAGIAGPRKHALAKKGSPEAHAIESPYKLAFMPCLHTEAVTAAMQAIIQLQDRLIDPRFCAFANRCGAHFYHLAKRLVDRDHKRGGANGPFEAAGDMDLIKR